MCSMFFPRSSNRTRSPFSVSSLAAHPPEIPDPTTIASYVVDCTAASACFVDQKVHQKLVERDRRGRLRTADCELRTAEKHRTRAVSPKSAIRSLFSHRHCQCCGE